MRSVAVVLLSVVTAGLLAYPLRGIFAADSYRAELSAHYSYDQLASTSQALEAATWLYLPNGLLACGFVLLAWFLHRPLRSWQAYGAAAAIAAYPFAKAFSMAIMGGILTRHMSSASLTLELSSDGLIYVVVGVLVAALPGLAAQKTAEARQR